MMGVTRILLDIEQGDTKAAEQLLPLVYKELRKLAAQKLAQEKPGQTLQATALVHEAYVRLVGGEPDAHWNGRGHFFAAAAEAMRRILIDRARHKQTRKAELVKLRFFAGLGAEQAAAALGVSLSTAEKDWAYARSWLRVAIDGASGRRP